MTSRLDQLRGHLQELTAKILATSSDEDLILWMRAQEEINLEVARTFFDLEPPKTEAVEECRHWDYVQVAHARWCIYCGALWRQHPGWILPRKPTHD